MAEIKRSTARTEQGIEVYESEIDRLCDEYIDRLNNPEDIKNRITFSGLLRYIYKHLFKPKQTDLIYNGKTSILDYGDIETLNRVYELFTDLCCRYQKEYTLNSFLTMTGISNDTINNWEKGIKIPNNNRYSSNYVSSSQNGIDNNIYNNSDISTYDKQYSSSALVNDIYNINNSNVNGENRVLPRELWVGFAKRVKQGSEQSLSESMLSGNLMAYATLKCWYGWKEEPQQLQVISETPHKTREEIALEFAEAQRPELPDLE